MARFTKDTEVKIVTKQDSFVRCDRCHCEVLETHPQLHLSFWIGPGAMPDHAVNLTPDNCADFCLDCAEKAKERLRALRRPKDGA